eukprot:GHVU01017613.1.p1 GENE.GHVU01017613.1~~GHVU01017613.1.p1  ORF type:complete len:109 (+),score=15.87 GHVU01017613.1:373-699(+)
MGVGMFNDTSDGISCRLVSSHGGCTLSASAGWVPMQQQEHQTKGTPPHTHTRLPLRLYTGVDAYTHPHPSTQADRQTGSKQQQSGTHQALPATTPAIGGDLGGLTYQK